MDMSLHTNETGCTVSVSHITGDVVCKTPGELCDCLIVARGEFCPECDGPRLRREQHGPGNYCMVCMTCGYGEAI
jgi:hypothetical protein